MQVKFASKICKLVGVVGVVEVVGVVSKNLAGWYEKLMIPSWKTQRKTKAKLDQLRFAAGKNLKIWQVSVNFKLVKLEDGSIVDLKAIPDCDFAFAAAILNFC